TTKQSALISSCIHPKCILHEYYLRFCTTEMDPICAANDQIYSSEFTIYSEMSQGFKRSLWDRCRDYFFV
uniref:Uncharacterized protein n=1 Tax=Neovison vison TaxID=452646 RepID=A0A8C7B4C2_NEOVI